VIEVVKKSFTDFVELMERTANYKVGDIVVADVDGA
jgi:hypothetical protein